MPPRDVGEEEAAWDWLNWVGDGDRLLSSRDCLCPAILHDGPITSRRCTASLASACLLDFCVSRTECGMQQ